MLGALGALLAGASADDNLNLASLGCRQESLCARLRKFDFVAVLESLSGLLTQPANHAASYRIEALIHLAAIHCRGVQRPTLAQYRQWLNDILIKDALGRGEDPVEDVFVTNVPSFSGNGRIFEGAWEDAAGYLTDLSSALLRLQGRDWVDQTLEEVMALIRLSEAMAERAGVARYAQGEVLPRRPVTLTARAIELGAAAVTFTLQDLMDLHLPARLLSPFGLRPEMLSRLADETLGHTTLERHPLVWDRDRIIIVLPTALSAAARRRALERAQAAGDLNELQAALNATQVQDLAQALRNIGVRLDGPPRELAPGITAITGVFDEGGYAAAILVGDDLGELLEVGLQGTSMLMAKLEEPVSALERELAARPGYQHGLTFMARGGLGRGYAAGFSDGPPSWFRATLPLGDLLRMSWDHAFSALRIWKILHQEDELEGKGYVFMNVNGFLNLYGYLDQVEFNFVPSQAAMRGMIALATDYVAPLRARIRRTLDQHLVVGPERNRWVEVQRKATDVFFEEVRGLPLYGAPRDAARGRLLACFESPTRPWWVLLDDREAVGAAGEFLYRIWDAAHSWLARIAPRLEAEFPDLPKGPIAIRLEFPGIAAWSEDRVLEDAPPSRPEIEVAGGVLFVRSDGAALRAYSDAVNIGERWLIAAIARGAAMLAGAARDEAWADAFASRVVVSNEARFVHAIPTTSAQEMIQSAVSLPRPRLVMDEDIAWSRLGLATLAGRSTPGPVAPGEEGALLQTAVLRLWERIRTRLEGLDRRSVVTRAILNHEAVDKDRAEWKHTAAALLALHNDQTDVVQTQNERESARAAAGTSSRALAEMAICTCPIQGGRACTDIDLDALIADLTIMLDCAGQCDAYHYGLAEAPLRVATTGSFNFDLGFLHSLHLPYLYAHQERAFRDMAEDYAEPFEKAGIDQESTRPPVVAEGFAAAMRGEFGMGVEDLIAFTFEVTEAALEVKEAILALPRSQVLDLLVGGDRREEVDAEKAFAALTLRPRARWDEPAPQGARARDWQPWRMNRKLALIRRPLVQLDEAADPLVLITPGLLDRAVRRVLSALDGRLPAEMFDSRAMDRWIGTVVDERGHAFNHQVMAALKKQGFMARSDVQLTELGGDKVLGDVDVLAWSPTTGEVWLIECKRLLMDRTVGEIGERLADYTTRGKRGGKRTPIQKHLDRIAFLQANPARLTALTGIAPTRLLIRSALVTDSIVPMQFTTRMNTLVDRVSDYRGLVDVFETHPPAAEA